MASLTSHDRIITTRTTRVAADETSRVMAALVCGLGLQDDWGVYVKPYRSAYTRGWSYAICVGRHNEQ